MTDKIPYIQDADEYQLLAERTKAVDYRTIAERFGITLNPDAPSNDDVYYKVDWDQFRFTIDLLHGVLGKLTELGEVADPLKKYLYYGRPLDKDAMCEECGDDLWYTAACLMPALGSDLGREMGANIYKLTKRYPDLQFDPVDALERKDMQPDDSLDLTSKHAECPQCGGSDFHIAPQAEGGAEITCKGCG